MNFGSSMFKCFLILFISFQLTLLFSQDDFETWKQQQDEAYREYKNANDKAFAQFLEDNWKNFALFTGEARDQIPKPVEIPRAEPVSETAVPDSVQLEAPPLPEPVIQEDPVEIRNSIAFLKPAKGTNTIINFWGVPVEVTIPSDLDLSIKKPIKEKSVADFWYKTSNSDHAALLEQLQEYKKRLSLNDWGYCLLLHELGKNLTNQDMDRTKLFVWFVLIKSGFEVKIGYNNAGIFLLMPTMDSIYGVSYIKFGEKKYYVINFEAKEQLKSGIYTYKGEHPDANSSITLSLSESPIVESKYIEKDVKFTYSNQEYIITIKQNTNTARFFTDYPQTNLEVYFNAPLSPSASFNLLSQLKPVIAGKSETVAVNMLLRFVQTAFPYKTDQDQFGIEKVFFADEFLYYPYSDCEDRSILFAYLVRNLVGLEVVGLDYPGHVATGVKFSRNYKGDAITHGQDRFLICDPTYINANIGTVMPSLRDVKPKVIKIG
ncbi:MAG: hypothetical protein JW784_01830 [Candidatus Cloacimonetes bacterium]|nr:hypothetical protein [Candidatus Cloacimonadota bacterium]